MRMDTACTGHRKDTPSTSTDPRALPSALHLDLAQWTRRAENLRQEGWQNPIQHSPSIYRAGHGQIPFTKQNQVQNQVWCLLLTSYYSPGNTRRTCPLPLALPSPLLVLSPVRPPVKYLPVPFTSVFSTLGAHAGHTHSKHERQPRISTCRHGNQVSVFVILPLVALAGDNHS